MEESSEEESSDEEPATKKVAPKKSAPKKAPAPAKAESSSEEDDSSEEESDDDEVILSPGKVCALRGCMHVACQGYFPAISALPLHLHKEHP